MSEGFTRGVYRYPNTLPAAWAAWKSGEPSGSGSGHHCVVITEAGRMDDVSCDDTYRFICQTALGKGVHAIALWHVIYLSIAVNTEEIPVCFYIQWKSLKKICIFHFV